MKGSYELGDECWIFAGATSERTGNPITSRGLVVAKFHPPHMTVTQYVVQLDDDDFMHMEIRDVFTMSGSADDLPSVAKLGTATPSSSGDTANTH